MNLPYKTQGFSEVDFDEQQKFDSVCESFRRREDALSLIFQLNQLIKAAARHRGLTMALIGGSSGFRSEFNELQYKIDRRIHVLRTFVRKTRLISSSQEDCLLSSWQTIRLDWQDDKLSDNFELHSHFIEHLQSLVVELAMKLEQSVARVANHDVSEYPLVFKQKELLNFVARELPEMIEQIAKVRGLGTYIAASGALEFSHDRKLRYLLQCVSQQNEKIRHQTERLLSIMSDSLPGLSDLKVTELKLIYLIETVEKDMLGGKTIQANSQQIFNLATDLIDIYWSVVNEGMSIVRKWNETLLEFWLNSNAS